MNRNWPSALWLTLSMSDPVGAVVVVVFRYSWVPNRMGARCLLTRLVDAGWTSNRCGCVQSVWFETRREKWKERERMGRGSERRGRGKNRRRLFGSDLTDRPLTQNDWLRRFFSYKYRPGDVSWIFTISVPSYTQTHRHTHASRHGHTQVIHTHTHLDGRPSATRNRLVSSYEISECLTSFVFCLWFNGADYSSEADKLGIQSYTQTHTWSSKWLVSKRTHLVHNISFLISGRTSIGPIGFIHLLRCGAWSAWGGCVMSFSHVGWPAVKMSDRCLAPRFLFLLRDFRAGAATEWTALRLGRRPPW